jgi:hypothetical protein
MAPPPTSGWAGRPQWLRPINKIVGHMADRLGHKDPEHALNRAEETLTSQINRTGPDSREANLARTEVAKWLEKLERWTEARVLREKVLASFVEHRGADDLHTLVSEEWLAHNLGWSGMQEEAKPLYIHVREVRRRTLGPGDEDTLRVEARLTEINRYLGLDE